MMNHIRITGGPVSLRLDVVASFGRDARIVVSGHNGAGKTTLLRVLAGLTGAEGGIVINGSTWLDSDSGFSMPPEKRGLGCVWADTALLPWLNVRDNIVFGSGHVGGRHLKALATSLEVDMLMRREPAMLSGGEAQRVALARALFRQPDILLLDEPFSAQAPALRRRLRRALKNLQRQWMIPLIMVSHDADDARQLADVHWHMREGRLLASVDGGMPERKEQI